MQFPLGKAVLVMILLAAVGAVGVLMQGARPRADIEVWAFTSDQTNAWQALNSDFYAITGKKMRVKQVSTQAIDIRLVSMMMSGEQSKIVPDIVTIEVGSVGKYFRPPADDVGFVPIENFLKRDGLEELFVKTRLKLWSKGGHLFGLPLDVHPVMLTYRKDLYAQAGIDLAKIKSWADFQNAGLTYQKYWGPEKFAAELPAASADVLYMMLLQRGVNLVDENNHVCLNDPRVLDTLMFYTQMVAGQKKIGQSAGGNTIARVRALVDGDVAAMITPDWEVQQIKQWGPELANKLAVIALPRFDESDCPTSTWGGTMVAIPRGCQDVDSAWQALKFLTTSNTNYDTLPALKSAWNNPGFHQPDPFFSNERVGELEIKLAGELPNRIITPFTTIATGELSLVLHRAVRAVQNGESLPELEIHCRQWLQSTNDDVEKYIRFGGFE